MTTKETLIKARGLIEKPEDWCQGRQTTRQNDGSYGAPYCAGGAIAVAARGYAVPNNSANWPQSEESGQSALARLESVVGPLAWYNNEHDHDCVLAAFDAAIEVA